MPHSDSTKSLVIFHANADTESVLEFGKHLEPWKTEVRLRIWHLGNIPFGTNRLEAIKKALRKADIVAFWVSPDLWADTEEFNFVRKNLPPSVQIVPIIARHTTWDELPFLKQYEDNVIPNNRQPMPSESKEPRDAWMDLAARNIAQKLGLLTAQPRKSRSYWSEVSLGDKLNALIGVLAILVPILIGYFSCPHQSKADSCADFPDRFVKDTLYVLITRFEDFQNEHRSTCYGESLRWHINDLAEDHNLPITVCYRDSVPPPADSREADRLRDAYHADLILWGRLDNAGPDCTADGFCLLFNPSDTLIRYVGGIPHKVDPSEFQDSISDSRILKGQFKMGKKFFDNWLIDMYNLKIGKKQPALMVIEENWEAVEKLEAYRTRANIWSGLGRHQEAITDWDQAIKISPNEALLYNNRGGEKFNLGRFDEAIADYDRALEIDPDFIFAYLNRGVAKLRSKAYGNEALHDLEHVAGLAPNFPNIYHATGDAYSMLRKYPEAIAEYNKALNSNPNDVRSYCNRAVAHRELGHLDEAIKDYDHVIKINPKHAGAYLNRGAAKARKGLFKDAIVDYDIVVKLNPNDAVVYNNRAGAWYNLQDYEKAAADYERALKISPNFEGASTSRKAALAKLGRYKLSDADYDEEIKRDSLNSLAYNNRGGAKYNARRYKEAIADYDQAVKLNPHFAAAFSNRATAKSALGDNEGALIDLDQAIKMDSNCKPCFLNRARIRDEMGLYTEALADYNRFVELGPKDTSAYLSRGDFWYERQNYKKAIEDYSRILEINPNQFDIYYKRSTAKRRSNRLLPAFADYCHATWLDPSTKWVWFVLLFTITYLIKFKTVNRILRGLFSILLSHKVAKPASTVVKKPKRGRKS